MTLGPVGQKISVKLSAAFAPLGLDVIDESSQHQGHSGARPDGESHFRVRIVAEAFRSKSRVEQHRMVNAALAEELKERVHALAIEAAAPNYEFIDIAPDDGRFKELLAAAKLSAADLTGKAKRYVGILDAKGKLMSAGGFEKCGTDMLLCSVAVDPALRGRKLGRTIVGKLLGMAGDEGVHDVYLLTNTAADFFAALGFEKISRDRVPAAVAATSQFSGKACASAQAMRARLNA
ncbi:MAG: GNAT family N-acetyltransferase [Rhizobiales bacterium]|nr:GNAT family N-acetyltransferase [Hyphomicrobiales bacterium]